MISRQEELLAEIGRLLDAKRLSPERAFASPIPGVNRFIEQELRRLADARPLDASTRVEAGALNALFRGTLARVWEA